MKKTTLSLISILALSHFTYAGGEIVPVEPAETIEVKPSGLLPLIDYSGSLTERSHLLGDLGGSRSDWAAKGFSFDIDYNQYFQGVTDGGLDTGSEYGGTIDWNINVDFDRMGLIPGGLLQMRAVSRYGSSLNGTSGALIPVNTDAAHPTTTELDEDVTLWLPMITYTQFLSNTFALSIGKMDMFGSTNEFAGGRGRSQWWNMNLSMPTSPALVVPYSMLAVAAVYMPSPNLTITSIVGTSSDTSNHSGFDMLNDELTALMTLEYKYKISDLPGGFTLMPGYGWDNEFNEINGRMNIEDGQLVPSTKDNTWFFSADMWQYLWVEGDASQAIDTADGRQDLQGVGIFSRIQTADKDTNPADFYFSVGINAKGLIRSRDNDAMGIAYSYNSINKGRFLDFIGIEDSSTAWELFYNVELTPAVHLTLDAQVVDSALPIDRATILGTSLQMRF
ncbi:MAG: carbohydrate porin [Sulfurovum sp.]|uniref:carbohydrate porin n=1 Tax=Sulfurovum sp. TaxID=1969726 RepID=UPI003C72C549